MREESVRVFLVDDHEVVRVGLQNMLAGYDDIAVVGSASSVFRFHQKRPATKNGIRLPCPSSAAGFGLL